MTLSLTLFLALALSLALTSAFLLRLLSALFDDPPLQGNPIDG